MRFKDLGHYLALRPHLVAPWAFVRLRSRPPDTPHFDVELKDGGAIRMRTPPHDRHILMDVYRHDEYRLNGLGPGSFGTVIDIGGHVGTFACRVAPLAARVIVFEPSPETFALLEHNTQRFANVVRRQMAVAGRSGKLSFYLPKSAPMHSIFQPQDRESAATIEVEATTLAEVFAKHEVEACDLLKIDCEGAEYEILYSLPEALWPRIRRIYMEYHPSTAEANWSGAALVTFLEKHGYSVLRRPSKKDARLGLIFAERS